MFNAYQVWHRRQWHRMLSRQAGIDGVGIAGARAVVVHGSEQDLARCRNLRIDRFPALLEVLDAAE